MCDKTDRTTVRPLLDLMELPLADHTIPELRYRLEVNQRSVEMIQLQVEAYALAYTYYRRGGDETQASKHAEAHKISMVNLNLFEKLRSEMQQELGNRNPFEDE